MDEVSLKNLLKGGEDSKKRHYGPGRVRSNSLDHAMYLKSKKLTVFGKPVEGGSPKIGGPQKMEKKERNNDENNNTVAPHRPRSVSLGQVPNSKLQTKARMAVVRRDSGRLKARIEATAAGLKELDMLRKAQQSLISEAKQLLLNKSSEEPPGKQVCIALSLYVIGNKGSLCN